MKAFLLMLFLIKKIHLQENHEIAITQCHWKCSACVTTSFFESDDYHHNCASCIEGTNFMVDSNNCYYAHELPGLYLDSSTNKYEHCSQEEHKCYECLVTSINCKSCLRGSQYDELLNECTQCDPTKYMYIYDGIQNCQGGESSTFTCQLKYTICTDIDINTEGFECPRDYPLIITGTNECAMEVYENKHVISNQIIKTQFLNKRDQIGVDNCLFMTMDFNSNGDLIFETNIFKESGIEKNRYYGIKPNGKQFFTEQKIIEADTTFTKFESQLINIKLDNAEDEKDYYMSCSSSSIEITNFENNRILVFSKDILFGNYAWTSKINTLLKLKNENNVYLFCLIAQNGGTNYIYLYKYKFYNSNLNEDNSFEKIQSSENIIISSPSRIINCIETSTFNIIQCFYINTGNYYVISLFDVNTLQLIQTSKIEETSLTYIDSINYDNYYYQCIYFKNDISIFAYSLNPNDNLIYIQIKNLVFDDINYILENYFSSNPKITINSDNKYTFSSYYYLSKLSILDDYRFCLITTSRSFFDIYVVLFDLYNSDSNLFIRYYHIPLKFYAYTREFNYIWAINYNGFLGLVYTSKQVDWYASLQYFSILSYINSRDSELIIFDSSTTLELNTYINENDIENNLFGVILYGIKILLMPRNIGVYYISEKKINIITENEILDPDDIIHFIFDYDNLIKGDTTYIIEMAGVVKEPSYQDFNKYPEKTEYYGDETQESYYSPRTYVGKTSFYNFKIPTSLIDTENICLNNCKVCYNEFCFKCNENFNLNEESHTCNICHNSCQTCNNGPRLNMATLEVEDTNCETCINNYYKVINTNNCFHKDNPPFAYYLDINKGLFVNCYENCKTCSKNKKNSTYFNCLTCGENSLFYEKSANCLDCVYLNKYVNYYQYKCIDTIPDGYYLLNPLTNMINKCYITCKHCNIQGNSDDHKCTECSDAYPYNYNNGQKCLDDCSKEKLYLESENKICYNDCSNNNLNNKKSNYKNKCISSDESPKNYILDENNNFISICDPKTDYEFNNECYKSCPDGTELDTSVTEKNSCICKSLYYLNGEDYICINSNICPNNYPYLKIGTSECSNCPVIYKGECLLECPPGTCITQTNKLNSKLCTLLLINIYIFIFN